MLTIKQQLVQLDIWFTIIIKDAYFHVKVAPKQRKLLRFAFQGVAYKYNRLQFSYLLAPGTFSKSGSTVGTTLRRRHEGLFLFRPPHCHDQDTEMGYVLHIMPHRASFQLRFHN